MDSINELKDSWGRMKGHRVFQILIPINAVVKAIKKFTNTEPRKEYKWIYDGCDCKAIDDYLSDPYCEKHYNKLTRKEI